jgi:hypothetical protein
MFVENEQELNKLQLWISMYFAHFYLINFN